MKRPSPLLFIYTGGDYTTCGAADQIGLSVIAASRLLATEDEVFQLGKIHQLAPLEATFCTI
ncbi:hypothetical protein ABKY47_001135 [Aeromonas hydrophila]